MNSHPVPQKRALVSANEADAVAVDNSSVHEEQIRALMMNRVNALTGRDMDASSFRLGVDAKLCTRNPTGI
jgi:hypothetical protein